jgi:putative endonuclease
MYFVYVIQSDKDGRLYVGLTQNLDQRIQYHNSGYVFSTKGYRSWKLVYTETAENRKEARTREKYFKSGIGKEFLKTLIRE